MHLLLTDHLTCPRCGPQAGLILLAERVEARRVYAGALGCPSCRQNYPVRDGVPDLKVDDTSEVNGDVAIEAEKLAALLGVTEGPAILLLLGRFEQMADNVADMLAEVEVIVAHDAMIAGVERAGVSRLRTGAAVPLRDRGMRGVAVANGGNASLVREGARVCGIAARLVVLGPSDEVRGWLPENGMRIMADQGQILVAVRHA